MKRFCIFFATLMTVVLTLSAVVDPLDKPRERPVIINGNPHEPTLAQPCGYYNLDTHYLTICFPSTDYIITGVLRYCPIAERQGG